MSIIDDPFLATALKELVEEATATIRKWRKLTLKPLKPNLFTFKLIKETEVEGMPDILTYEVNFPEVKDPDVVKQYFDVFTKAADGVLTQVGETQVYDRSVSQQNIDVPQDSRVLVRMTHEDDSLNQSKREQEFDAKDTLVPAEPGSFGEIKLVSEREG